MKVDYYYRDVPDQRERAFSESQRMLWSLDV
jgi:hypothetical protein